MQKLQKEFFERNFPKFTRKFLFLIFFHKVRRCISASSLKATLQWRCFLWNFAKFVRTSFSAKQHQRTASDYSNINPLFNLHLLYKFQAVKTKSILKKSSWNKSMSKILAKTSYFCKNLFNYEKNTREFDKTWIRKCHW